MNSIDVYFTKTIVGPARRLELGVRSAHVDSPRWPSDDEANVTRSNLQRGIARGLSVVMSRVSAFRGSSLSWWSSTDTARVGLAVIVATAGFVVLRAGDKIRFVEEPARAQVLAAGAPDAQAFPIMPAASTKAGLQKPSSILVAETPFGNTSPVPPGVQSTSEAIAPPPRAMPTAAPVRQAEATKNDAVKSLLVVDGAKVDEKRPTERPTAAKQPAALPKDASSGVAVQNPVLGAPGEDQQRVTIVDIAKDGSFVLITNPKTRLPERFAVGQKIFTGETVQKIDQGAGKVQLDKRTVGLQ